MRDCKAVLRTRRSPNRPSVGYASFDRTQGNEEFKRSRSIPRHFAATCQVQGLLDLPRNDGLRIPRQQPPSNSPLAVPEYSDGLVPRCS